MIFFWILLYGLLYMAAEAAAPLAGYWPWLIPLVMLGYILMLLCYLVHTGQQKTVGLSAMQRMTGLGFLHWIPMLLFPVMNLSGAASVEPLHGILLMFCVSFAEEILFRGYFLSTLVCRYGKWGILYTSLLFALMHSVNILSGMPPFYVLMQVILAFFVGVYYSLSRIYFRSLYPSVIAHFLTNITAHSGDIIIGNCLILIVVLSCCGWILYSKISSDLEDIS